MLVETKFKLTVLCIDKTSLYMCVPIIELCVVCMYVLQEILQAKPIIYTFDDMLCTNYYVATYVYNYVIQV